MMNPKILFGVYRQIGYETKKGIELRKFIDVKINDSINYIKKTNNEYIETLRNNSH